MKARERERERERDRDRERERKRKREGERERERERKREREREEREIEEESWCLYVCMHACVSMPARMHGCMHWKANRVFFFFSGFSHHLESPEWF